MKIQLKYEEVVRYKKFPEIFLSNEFIAFINSLKNTMLKNLPEKEHKSLKCSVERLTSYPKVDSYRNFFLSFQRIFINETSKKKEPFENNNGLSRFFVDDKEYLLFEDSSKKVDILLEIFLKFKDEKNVKELFFESETNTLMNITADNMSTITFNKNTKKMAEKFEKIKQIEKEKIERERIQRININSGGGTEIWM